MAEISGHNEPSGSVAVIVPAYNEANSIEALLNRLTAVMHSNWQVIVVDDGSTDDTAQIAERICDDRGFTFVSHSVNSGKTAAIRSALEHVTRERTIVQDADLEYDPADIHRLEAAVEGCNIAVYGLRPSCWHRPERWILASGVLGIDLLFFCFYRKFVRDHATCYKLIPTMLLKNFTLESSGFEGCVELTAKLMRSGVSIRQVSIGYAPRSRAEGKKLTVFYGWTAVKSLLKWRHWRPSLNAERSSNPGGRTPLVSSRRSISVKNNCRTDA